MQFRVGQLVMLEDEPTAEEDTSRYWRNVVKGDDFDSAIIGSLLRVRAIYGDGDIQVSWVLSDGVGTRNRYVPGAALTILSEAPVTHGEWEAMAR